jgi:hypothetical protein
MNLKTPAIALAAAVAAFVIVGVAVTELAGQRMEFSLFVGIPAGLVSGAVAGAAVVIGLGSEEGGNRRIAAGFGAFGVAFLATFLVGAFLIDAGVVLSILVGGVVGVVAAPIGYLRGPKTPPTATA